MFAPEEYELLDFGEGRRLERFGALLLDRPCPAAELASCANPEAWRLADARFEGRAEEKGEWTCRHDLPDRWAIRHSAFQFELKRTEFGHLGVFPEQAENWDWIARQVGSLADGQKPAKPFRVLNLFGYTGGSTLAAAAAGAEVAHVDAARNVVAWARRNAELSGLADAPIRWIVEDAAKFAARELKRGKQYDAVILDPPSYGHGPHGEVWRLAKDLPPLLEICRTLTAEHPAFVLLTCHTPGYDAAALSDMIQEAFGTLGHCTARELLLRAASGESLHCGVMARWSISKSVQARTPTPQG